MNKIEIDTVNICNSVKLNLDEIESNIINIGDNCEVLIDIDSFKFEDYIFNLKDNASLRINKMYELGNVLENITINLNGVGSKIEYYFSTLVKDNQKFVINVNHNNLNTISNIYNHGVVLNDSHLTFEVNASVKKGNKGCFLNQESKIITMGKNNSDIKPNLFVDEFDVEARHAATIGKFNKDEIFYLMTKGISYSDSLNLLIKGFLEGNIRR